MRVAVAGRPALERVGDEHVGARQADLVEELLEQLARLPDEGQPLLVLVLARRLADEHQVRVGVARAEHDGVARRGELRAAGAVPRLLVDGLERLSALLLRRRHDQRDAARRARATKPQPAHPCPRGSFVPHHIVTGTPIRGLDRPRCNSSIAVIGQGRMGIALAAALRAPAPLGRGNDGAGAEIVLLCVPDSEIAAAAALRRARPRRPLLGRDDAGPLAPHEAFSLHPLMTVPRPAHTLRRRQLRGRRHDAASSRAARALATRLAMRHSRSTTAIVPPTTPPRRSRRTSS